MRVLVTGSAGFIGSHVVDALNRRGDFVIPIDMQDNARDDIRLPNALWSGFAESPIDVVIHLAAKAGVRASIASPSQYEQTNVGGTLRLLELCREFKPSKFIFASSSSVYGDGPAPFFESQIDLRPMSPYAATKLAGEIFCATYSRLYQLPMVALRFFTVYGPRQREDLAIRKFVALIEAGKPLPVFGSEEAARDYTYVDDIVTGILAAADFTPQHFFEVFNLGSSHPVRLWELITALEQATGKVAIRKHYPHQPGDVFRTWADISKAEKLLNWHPQTTLEDGLRKFVDWYREFAAESVNR